MKPPSQTEERDRTVRLNAEAMFREFVEHNYPSGCVISDPSWHAPRLFHAATKAWENAAAECRPVLGSSPPVDYVVKKPHDPDKWIGSVKDMIDEAYCARPQHPHRTAEQVQDDLDYAREQIIGRAVLPDLLAKNTKTMDRLEQLLEERERLNGKLKELRDELAPPQWLPEGVSTFIVALLICFAGVGIMVAIYHAVLNTGL